VDRCACSR